MKQKITFAILLPLFVFISCSKNVADSKANIQQVSHDVPAMGTSVKLSTASSMAIEFLQARFHSQNLSVQNAVTLTRDGVPYFHIINANKGFVIVGVDSMLLPILAYDSSGKFSLEDKYMNAGIALWINKQAIQFDFLRNTKTSYTDSIVTFNKLSWVTFKDIYGSNSAMQVRDNNTRVNTGTQNLDLIGSCSYFSGNDGYWNNTGALCGVNWYQGNPYNQFCPLGSGSATTGGHDPTGCNATSIAQVMRYWNYPSSYNIQSQAAYVDKSDPNFDPVIHPEKYVQTARLMHDIGITQVQNAPFASYSNTGTFAIFNNSQYIFQKFGYTGIGTTAGYASQSTPVFSGPGNNSNTNLFITEVSNYKRPCLLDGWPGQSKQLFGVYYTATGVGHAWVCDGVSQFFTSPYNGSACNYSDRGLVITKTYTGATYLNQGFLHMNWGLVGTRGGNVVPNNDGWYDYNTDYMMVDANADYKYFQQVLYNIHP